MFPLQGTLRQEDVNGPIKACTSIANLWLFVHALSFLNADRQARKQHLRFLCLWYDFAGFEPPTCMKVPRGTQTQSGCFKYF